MIYQLPTPRLGKHDLRHGGDHDLHVGRVIHGESSMGPPSIRFLDGIGERHDEGHQAVFFKQAESELRFGYG
jgi:hypothetical protein